MQQIVKGAKKVEVIGSRHSFTKIADSDDTIISTLGMNSILGLNTKVPSVTVQAGITYTDLASFLRLFCFKWTMFISFSESVGFGLENLAALGEISVGGAISTGTKGSGLTHLNLPSQVRSIQLVLANGKVANYTRNDPEMKGIALGLGAFGVMTQIELDIVPTYNITSNVFLK